MSKKLLILVLVCILVFPLGLAAKEKQGANLILQKKDGQSVRGELITIKQDSLLLLSDEGADVSVAVGDIQVIQLVKKSRAGIGAGIGFGLGAAFGTALAFLGEPMSGREASTVILAGGGIRRYWGIVRSHYWGSLWNR